MVLMAESLIVEVSQTLERRLWAWTYYGTSVRATYTMFEVTLSGCWPNYVRLLLETTDTLTALLYGLFFMAYILLVVFAIIRVITAIFLKETMDACNTDNVDTERAHKRRAYLRKLENMFLACDSSSDGLISEEEFTDMLCDPVVKSLLGDLELEVHEGLAFCFNA